MGLTRFELVTPRLSSVCSNQLSYRPSLKNREIQRSLPVLSKLDSARFALQPLRARSIIELSALVLEEVPADAGSDEQQNHSRKEVIQPQVLLQLPCYDFTPITDHTLGAYLPCGLTRRLLVQPAFVM